MEVNTEHGSLKTQSISGQTAADYLQGGTAHAEYMRKQIKYLQDYDVDNVVFESGSIRCNTRAGRGSSNAPPLTIPTSTVKGSTRDHHSPPP